MVIKQIYGASALIGALIGLYVGHSTDGENHSFSDVIMHLYLWPYLFMWVGFCVAIALLLTSLVIRLLKET